MTTITDGLKNRFLVGYKIPITITTEPYFTDRLETYDPFYHCVEKYESFKKEMLDFANEEKFFSYYTFIKEEMMNNIKKNPSFIEFDSVKMNWEVDEKYRQLPSKDIYHHDNIGRRFLSVDMIKANFSSMRKFSPDIFHNKSTWEEYVASYTDSRYFIDSKYIREVVLGNCNPKRQTTYEKYLMSQLLSSIDSTIEDMPKIVFFSNDEFIFDITEYDADKLVEFLKNYTEIPIRIEIFTLNGIYNDETNIGYIKKFDDDTFSIKKSTQMYLPSIIRTLRGEEITDSDLVFVFEKTLCKVLEKPKIIIRDHCI